MVQARGGVQISLREIPNYGVVVVDPLKLLSPSLGAEPLLLSINSADIVKTPLSELRSSLRGTIGSSVRLELVSAKLDHLEAVTLPIIAMERETPNDISTLQKSFEFLDTFDHTDWSNKLFKLSEKSSESIFEPLTSTLHACASKVSTNWLNRHSFVHFFTHMIAAHHFDQVYRIDEANVAIDLALRFLPYFDSLDFDDSIKLFDLVDYLQATNRTPQAETLLAKLWDAAKNSIDSATKMLLCLKRQELAEASDFFDVINPYFDKNRFSISSEDLHFIGDSYLRNGDFQRAIKAYSLLSIRSKSTSHENELHNFVQPSTYSQFKLAFAQESIENYTLAQETLQIALQTFRSNFSEDQIRLIDELPGFFPKPKDIEAKLTKTTIAMPTLTFNETPFHMKLRSALDSLSISEKGKQKEKIAKIIDLAYQEDDVASARNIIFSSFFNLARRASDIQDFDLAKLLLAQVVDQADGPDFAPLYLIGGLTDQAILAEQLGLNREVCWSKVQALLLNFIAGSELRKDIEQSQREAIVRARALRLWSLVYLRNNDFKRAEQILLRSLSFLEPEQEKGSAPHIVNMISRVSADLAVAQIGLSKIEESTQTIEKVFAGPPIFSAKISQIADAYAEKHEIEKAESILSTCLSWTKPVDGVQLVFKLARLRNEHSLHLEEAMSLLSPHNTTPHMILLMADFAASQMNFEIAQQLYQRAAAHLSMQSRTRIEINYLKRAVLLKALEAAEQNNHLTFKQEVNLVKDVADLSYGVDKLIATVNYRRVLGMSPTPAREWQVARERLDKLIEKKSLKDQFAEEKKLLQDPNREYQVRTENYWVTFAGEEIRNGRLSTALLSVEHALEIFALSPKRKSNFQPLFLCDKYAFVELMRQKGFTQDAESYLLQAVSAATSKYGVDSEQESLCLAELALFHVHPGNIQDAEIIVSQILSSYLTSAIPSATAEKIEGNVVISRLRELALQMTTKGYLLRAVKLLEDMLAVEQKTLPAEHIDVVDTMLLLARLKKQDGQLEVAEVIFEKIYQGTVTESIYPSLVRFAQDYCEVLSSLGKLDASQKITYLFSNASDTSVAEHDASIALTDPKNPWFYDGATTKEEAEWEKIGRTDKAKERYCKSIKLVQELGMTKDLASEALNSIAAHYVENNKLGQAAEIYLELSSRLQKIITGHSFRKVLTFLSLARCYTRLCMYEEVPDLVLQAKESDPEISSNFRTVETILNYVDVEVEAHLLEVASEDLKLAESLVDEQCGEDHAKKRMFMERIHHYWVALDDDESIARLRTEIEKLPPLPLPTKPIQASKETKITDEETNVTELATEPKPTQTTPPPFALLECISPESFDYSTLDQANPACVFLKNLADKISENWFPPIEKQPTQLQLKFSIASDGNWEVIKAVRRSANKYANSALEEAIQAAAPFEHLPDELGDEAIFVLTVNDAVYSLNAAGILFESLE